ncbi:glycine zipper family protein [Amaricoccus macauensis]|uniref:glycine zipper family protein n=1 Tax=Amaricoccus macauensis TaxID=57001 RepID=UPI003C7A0E8B
MRPFCLPIFATALLAACADSGANYTPIIDGPASPEFDADLADCQLLAANQKQFDEETLGAAVLGAGAGAILGAADEDSDDLEGAAGGLIIGGLAGGTAGAVSASDRREAIVVECMRGRGHPVVG